MKSFTSRKRRSMKSKEIKSPYIPQEIITEILLKLPMPFIVACKLVCKQFNKLVNDPNFFNRYRDKSLALFVTNHSFYCVLLRNDAAMKTVTIKHRRRFPAFTVVKIPISFNNGSPYKLLSNPSNGIACVEGTNGHFILHNLFDGSSYTVANSPLLENPFGLKHCYGFGYDRHADDYKLVVAFDDGLEIEEKAQFSVYSFKLHAWKPLKGFPYDIYGWEKRNHNRACYVNGVFHWVVTTEENHNTEVIVTYDIRTRRFGEIMMFEMDYVREADVSELGGKLCCSWIRDRTFYVWMMKEYGVKESWTMLFRIDGWMIKRKDISYPIVPLELYEVGGGRKVVLCACQFYGSLFWCDVENGEVKVMRQSVWQRTRVVGGKERVRKHSKWINELSLEVANANLGLEG